MTNDEGRTEEEGAAGVPVAFLVCNGSSPSSFEIRVPTGCSTFGLTRLAVSADGGFGRPRSVPPSADRKELNAMRLALCPLPPASHFMDSLLPPGPQFGYNPIGFRPAVQLNPFFPVDPSDKSLRRNEGGGSDCGSNGTGQRRPRTSGSITSHSRKLQPCFVIHCLLLVVIPTTQPRDCI